MKGLVGFGVSAAALLVAAASQYATVQSLASIDRRVAQTSAIVDVTDSSLTAVREVESASRGYAATGDDRFLEQVKAGARDARAGMRELQRLAAGNPRELQILERLEANVSRLLTSADEVVDAKRDKGATAASDAIREGVRLRLMIETLNLIDWLKDEENSQVEAKVAEGREAGRLASLLTGIVTVLALGLIGMGWNSIRARNVAEQALRQEQEFNAVALECLHDGIVTTDATGGNVRLNRSAQSLGAKPEHLPLARTLAGERVRSETLSLGDRVVLTSGQPVFSKSGEKLGAIISLHDITDLQRAEARYRSVLAAMSEGVTVQNENGEIVACNASASRILGISKDQLTGRYSTDPEWRAIREDLSPFPGQEHPSMQVLRTRRPVENVRLGLPRPDGEITWLSINAEPLEDPLGVVVTFVDITANKRAEDALRDREAELQEAQRLSGVGSWSWNPATDEVHWSVELYRIFGVDPSLPVPPREQRRAMFMPESYARGEEALRELLRSGKAYEIVLELVPFSGRPCRVVARGEASYDPHGNLRRVRGTVGRME